MTIKIADSQYFIVRYIRNAKGGKREQVSQMEFQEPAGSGDGLLRAVRNKDEPSQDFVW